MRNASSMPHRIVRVRFIWSVNHNPIPSLLLLSSSSLISMLRRRADGTSISYRMVAHFDSLVSASKVDPRHSNLPLSARVKVSALAVSRKAKPSPGLTLITDRQPAVRAQYQFLTMVVIKACASSDLPFSDVVFAPENLCSR